MQKFNDSGLKPEILKAIEDMGFVEPTEIQKEAIPFLLEKTQDMIGLAQTGTGKTAAFGLPIIQQVEKKGKQVEALILSPTRELCIQISKELENFSKYSKNVEIAAIYGGANIDTQIKQLSRGVNIVAGTPGRVLDLIKRKRLQLENLRWLVLDEADEMLNMGFKEELDQILETTPENKQTMLFSATMPDDILNIVNRNMKNPHKITIGKRNMGTENVSHEYYMVQARDRYLALKRVVDINPDIYGLVFCRTRRETKEVAENLMADGYNADALHGDLTQPAREMVMHKMRTKNLQILVATDVAARGLDVSDLTHVINYNLPDDVEVYTHRSGRTGRAGRKGQSVSIIHTKEKGKIKQIQKMIGRPFELKKVPTGPEICERQLFALIDRFGKVEVDDEKIAEYLPRIYQKLEHFDKEELIRRFISIEFNRFLDYYKDAKDLNVDSKKKENPSEKKQRGNDDFVRFFISIGAKDNLNIVKMIGFINDTTNTRNIEIGKIDIMKAFSFFEIERKHEQTILKSFKDAKYNDVAVTVEVAEARDEKPQKRQREKKDAKRNRRPFGNNSKGRNRKK